MKETWKKYYLISEMMIKAYLQAYDNSDFDYNCIYSYLLEPVAVYTH